MSSAGLIETTTEIRGGKIAWSSLGAGPLAVVAHGLTQSRRATVRSRLFDWTPIASAGRRLVEYDARGHGLSGGPKNPVAYTWPELATDLLDLIQELAGDQPVAGVGSSMGTATLLHAVTRSPGRFDRLVLTAPPTAWATRAAQAGMYSAGADLIEARGMQAF
ncbi:MAG: hypothetical protein JWM76_3194, partial [Pseudonocardiales bacterium]|nr:hypothetical protein [Pseudonocardiales bacterium]